VSEVVGGYPADTPADTPPEPPAAVRTASILMYVVAGLALVQGLLSFVVAAVDRTRLATALLALAFALAYVVLARRVRQGDRTARTVAVALCGLSVLGDLVQLRANAVGGVVGVLLNGGIIFLLAVHPRSRAFFGTHAGSGPA